MVFALMASLEGRFMMFAPNWLPPRWLANAKPCWHGVKRIAWLSVWPAQRAERSRASVWSASGWPALFARPSRPKAGASCPHSKRFATAHAGLAANAHHTVGGTGERDALRSAIDQEINRSREFLLALYRDNPRQLGDFGLVVNDSPTPAKKAKPAAK